MKVGLTGWMFAAPALGVIILFFGIPVLAAFVLSLTDFDIYALADIGNLRFEVLRADARQVHVLLVEKLPEPPQAES